MINIESIVDRLREIIDDENLKQLKETLDGYHAADLTDIFSELNPKERLACFKQLDEEKAADLLEYLPPQLQVELLGEIDEEYVKSLFASEMKKGTKKSVLEMSQDELSERLSYFTGAPSEALNELKSKIQEKLDDDLANKFTITQAGKDRTQELSSGLDAQIYFDILSYETSHDGMYIIDQPEDNISQKAVRDYLLDRFKIMGEHRQVLMVTHRPQFIVNLDVDNVIFIGKEDDKIYIQSGALEYRDADYNILDIISDHIEGGLDTLRRRWKRYEKNTSI